MATVDVVNPAGEVIAHLPMPGAKVTNLAFGGEALYVSEGSIAGIWRLDIGVRGRPSSPTSRSKGEAGKRGRGGSLPLLCFPCFPAPASPPPRARVSCRRAAWWEGRRRAGEKARSERCDWRAGWAGWAPRRRSRCWRAPGRWRPRASTSSTWRSASRTSTRRANVVEAGVRGAAGRLRPTTGPRPGMPELRQAIAAYVNARAALSVDAGAGRRHAGRQADHVLRHPGAARGGRRGDLPQPRLPDLRVDDRLRRRDGRAAAAARGERLRASTSTSCARLITPRTTPADHQLAGQPDRRRARAASRSGGDRRAGRRARPDRAGRRDLRRDPLRGRARQHRDVAGHGRADDHARRLLQDLRDDRLAARLRRHAAGARAAHRPADGQQRLLHRRPSPRWPASRR